MPPSLAPPPSLLPACPDAERNNVSDLKSQLSTVQEAVTREQDLSEKIRREAMSAAASAARQVCG